MQKSLGILEAGELHDQRYFDAGVEPTHDARVANNLRPHAVWERQACACAALLNMGADKGEQSHHAHLHLFLSDKQRVTERMQFDISEILLVAGRECA